MSPSDAEYAAGLVARRLGLPIQATLSGAELLVLTPSEIHENDGFSVEVRTSWRTLEVRFLAGKFARPLVKKMGDAGPEGRVAFSALAAVAAKQGKVTLRANGLDLNAQEPASWPSQWQKLDLAIKKQGIVFEELAPRELKRLLGEIVTPLFGMCIALIGIEDVEADASAAEGDPTERLSRRYERRLVNREVCLATRGRRCYCCNMDFGEVYGSSADGFIEVHHITPASGMGPGYKINPALELVPICSNCHSAVHLQRPARSVEEVRALFDVKLSPK